MAESSRTPLLSTNERIQASGGELVAAARTNMAEAIRSRVLSIFTWFGILQVLGEIVAQSWILFVSRGEPCDQPLRGWIIVRMIIQVLSLGLDMSAILDGSYDEAERGEHEISPSSSSSDHSVPIASGDSSSPLSSPHQQQTPLLVTVPSPPRPRSFRQRMSSIRKGIAGFYLLWFIAGNIWILRCETCERDAPELFRLCLALILLHYMMMALPLAMVVCLLTCLPVVIISLAWFAGLASALQKSAVRRRISSIPTVKYRSGLCPEEDAMCVVCQGVYEDGEELRQLQCRHLFHTGCIDRWLVIQPICPMCRRGLEEGNENLPPV